MHIFAHLNVLLPMPVITGITGLVFTQKKTVTTTQRANAVKQFSSSMTTLKEEVSAKRSIVQISVGKPHTELAKGRTLVTLAIGMMLETTSERMKKNKKIRHANRASKNKKIRNRIKNKKIRHANNGGNQKTPTLSLE